MNRRDFTRIAGLGVVAMHTLPALAFNSTFIALVISIVLMFFIHQLQLLQERLVLDSENYCDQNLISRLKS